MEGYMSVWVDIENYKEYKKGRTAISWEASSKNERLNLLVPLSHVQGVYDNDREGIEIDIRQSLEAEDL